MLYDSRNRLIIFLVFLSMRVNGAPSYPNKWPWVHDRNVTIRNTEDSLKFPGQENENGMGDKKIKNTEYEKRTQQPIIFVDDLIKKINLSVTPLKPPQIDEKILPNNNRDKNKSSLLKIDNYGNKYNHHSDRSTTEDTMLDDRIYFEDEYDDDNKKFYKPQEEKKDKSQEEKKDKLNNKKNHFTVNPPTQLTCGGRKKLSTLCTNVTNYPDDLIGRQLKAQPTLKLLEIKDTLSESEISHRFGGDNDDLCMSEETTIRPKKALNVNDEWVYVVNNDDFVQEIKIEICRREDVPCNVISNDLNQGWKSSCKQKYIHYRLLALHPDGELRPDIFQLPASCCCHVEFNGDLGTD